VGASTRGNTPTREGQGVPCDAQTNTCIPDAAEGGSLAGAMERILNFLALTGWGVLPWIVITVGLTALGIFLLRSSRRRTSRTGPAKSTSAASGRRDAGPVRSRAQPPASG
jgi:hypothetical protein